jgi:hypothetical protein
MSILVFTICAKNYIGLAKVLQRSIAQHGPEVDFRIYVADDDGSQATDAGIVPAARSLEAIISPVEYANMAFMYDVTEFCTSIKAACFQHAFADGHETCIYMDPDIFVVSDISQIVTALAGRNILMTPHLCLPAVDEGPRADSGILATGVYNLGFLALRDGPATHQFLKWWHQRLRSQAFNDHYNALYTDQRWMDFVPALFPSEAVRVWRHLGCNVAPWNYHERRIVHRDGHFTVTPRTTESGNGEWSDPLIFLHFSGFDFRRILDGTFDQLNLADAREHVDVTPLYELYGAAIRAEADDMTHHLALSYDFGTFADGSTILPSHRRLFRVWRERNGDATAPFATGPQTFHDALKRRGLLGEDDSGALAADKVTARSIKGADRLLARAQQIFRLLYRVLGRSRFILFVRSLNRLSRIEQHYDTLGMDKMSVTIARQGEPQ